MKLKVELRGRVLFLFPVKLCGIEAVDQYKKRCFSYKYCINKNQRHFAVGSSHGSCG